MFVTWTFADSRFSPQHIFQALLYAYQAGNKWIGLAAAVHDFFPHPNLVVTTLWLSGSGSSTLKVVSVVKKPPVMPKSNKGDFFSLGVFGREHGWRRMSLYHLSVMLTDLATTSSR
jgi:hypothetical protein